MKFRSVSAIRAQGWRGALLGALICSPLLALAQPDALHEAEARYRAERAACLDGRSPQDRPTCLKEAGAALAEARAEARRAVPQRETPDYAANALARCERLPEPDREDCRLIVQGQGSRDGSVADGGILYQLVTRSVGGADPPASRP